MEVLVHWIEVRKYDFPEKIKKEIAKTYGKINKDNIEDYIMSNDVSEYEIKVDNYGFDIVDYTI